MKVTNTPGTMASKMRVRSIPSSEMPTTPFERMRVRSQLKKEKKGQQSLVRKLNWKVESAIIKESDAKEFFNPEGISFSSTEIKRRCISQEKSQTRAEITLLKA